MFIHILCLYLASACWSVLYIWSISALLFILHFVILFCSNRSWIPFLRDPFSSCHFIPILSLLQSVIAKFAPASFKLSWENDRKKKVLSSVLGFLSIHSTGSNCNFPFVEQAFIFFKGNGRSFFLKSLLKSNSLKPGNRQSPGAQQTCA